MILRHLNWIWHVQGSLVLAPGQSIDQAFEKLSPVFRQVGTSYERTNDTLTFRKKDPAAQDKMSVFNSGVLRIETAEAGSVLWYRLQSPTLLFCFLLPILFLAIGQLTIEVGKHQKPSVEVPKKVDEVANIPMNPIDKAFGAPAPEKKGTDKASKDKAKLEKLEKEKQKFSPMPAYVFAAIFAILYVVGRVLEDRLVRKLFRNRLKGS